MTTTDMPTSLNTGDHVVELETHANWTASHIGNPDDWTLQLTDAHHAELDDALALARSTTDDVLDVTVDDFPLPTLGPHLAAIANELVNGRGFARIAALDVDRLGAEDASWIYWGIGMHLGEPWPQNAKGHLLGDVKDQGKAPDDPTARGNEIGGHPLGFHSDGSDLVGLLCIDSGVSGGESLVANAVGAYNALGAHAARSRCGALRAAAVRLPWRAARRRPTVLCSSGVHATRRSHGRPALRAIHQALHRGIATTPRRAPADRSPDRGNGRLRRADQRPRQPGRDGVATGRHPVRQQLPRPARPPSVRRRHRRWSGPVAEAAVAGDRHPRPRGPSRPFPARRRDGPLGLAPNPCLTSRHSPNVCVAFRVTRLTQSAPQTGVRRCLGGS